MTKHVFRRMWLLFYGGIEDRCFRQIVLLSAREANQVLYSVFLRNINTYFYVTVHFKAQHSIDVDGGCVLGNT